jgi:hypothetical protein
MMRKKEIVILACSKSKIWDKKGISINDSFPAREAYTGYVFKAGKQYAIENKLPLLIISAKYGLIEPEQDIEHYNCKLISIKCAEKLRNQHLNQLMKIFDNYNKIFLIGGNKYYRMVFQGFKDDHFHYLKVRNQGELKNKVKALISK